MLNFKLANLATDHQIVQAARISAQDLMSTDPQLLEKEKSI